MNSFLVTARKNFLETTKIFHTIIEVVSTGVNRLVREAGLLPIWRDYIIPGFNSEQPVVDGVAVWHRDN
jgi:hypothetical protein